MVIKNSTQNTILTHDAIIGKSFKDKSLGLLTKEKPQAFFFKTRFGIHTIGMKFSLDILILDKQNKIVKLKKGLKPNNIFIWNPKHNAVLELPSGTISKSKTEIGNEIHFSSNDSQSL